jgi:hypothetical protein
MFLYRIRGTSEIFGGYRYWRVLQTSITRGGTAGYEWHIGNINIIATTATDAQLTAQGRYQQSASNVLSSPLRDGSTIGGLLSAGYGVFLTRFAGNYVDVDFGEPVIASSMQYYNAVGASWAPTTTAIEASGDRVTWTRVSDFTDNGTTALQVFTW